jgi:hypothetical protein
MEPVRKQLKLEPSLWAEVEARIRLLKMSFTGYIIWLIKKDLE